MQQQDAIVKRYTCRRPNDPKRFTFPMPWHQKRKLLQLLHFRPSLDAEAQSESLSQPQAVFEYQARPVIVEDSHAGA